MYIYSKPQGLGHAGLEGSKGDNAMSLKQEPLSRPHQQHPLSPSSSSGPTPTSASASASTSASTLLPSSSKPVPPERLSRSRPRSFPFSIPTLLFQPNPSSTSLAPSIAEGRPIPLDDAITAHRTSALQKLNSTYPSATRGSHYAKSTGAQSSTYSQPVLVRTYSGPSPSQSQASYNVQSQRYRPSSSSRGGSRRVPLPLSSRSGAGLSSRPTKPALSGLETGGGGDSNESNTLINESSISGVNMPHHKTKKSSSKKLPLPWQWPVVSTRQEPDEAKLPPLEAFSFKSFMAEMQARGGENDIGADLDRIAEICAHSRYSLSNQYEVHVSPHGTGIPFGAHGVASSSSGSRRKSRSHGHGTAGGPTLQAITSDDDENSAARSHRKRKSTGRRRSAAYGTLETIMSSSRSSEEDKTKTKKKSAAEIADEIRGRVSIKNWDNSTASGSGSGSTSRANAEDGSHGTTTTRESGDNQQEYTAKLARKKSASFATALMDTSRSTAGQQNDAGSSSQHKSTLALVSEPALPQTSSSHLGVRTTAAPGSDGPSDDSNASQEGQPESSSQSTSEQIEVHLADQLPHQASSREPVGAYGGLHQGWGAWIPWRGSGAQQQTITETSSATKLSYPRDTATTLSHAEGSLRQLLKTVNVTAETRGKPSTAARKDNAR
ncbi:hypothetical protein B0T17DRAFT_586836 [Bombardia bombarda]|uniref:Uncharacterized protein n=1 Tax=Bombardia bombarda TaxID=252184 RepID=A0AA39XJQ4_9PEZI|nr:hypothetical protein B0T17DRAFT_586836 [Bombardia bombarda]